MEVHNLIRRLQPLLEPHNQPHSPLWEIVQIHLIRTGVRHTSSKVHTKYLPSMTQEFLMFVESLLLHLAMSPKSLVSSPVI